MRATRGSGLGAWRDDWQALVAIVGPFLVFQAIGYVASLRGASDGTAILLSFAGMASFVVTALVIMWSPRRLDVGADGVTIGGTRFISFADVAHCQPDTSRQGRQHHLFHLRLRSGELITVGSHRGTFGQGNLGPVDAACAQLQVRLEAYRAHAPSAHAAELARGERPNERWVAELRAKGGEGGFRDGELARAEVLAVAEDPTADATARAAAALVLRPALAPAERARLRVAAEATAAPKVRVVLEAAADEAASEDAVASLVASVAPGSR